jgi:hypothetical protein
MDMKKLLPETKEAFEKALRAGDEDCIISLAMACMRFGPVLMPKGLVITSLEEAAALLQACSLAFQVGLPAEGLELMIVETWKAKQN